MQRWAIVAVCAAIVGASAIAITTLLPPTSRAQVAPGGTISEIRIEGTERVEPETVKSYMTVQPGDPFDSDRIDRTLKALFATGLFSDVRLSRVGDALIVKVVENPVLNRIAFEGNRKLSDENLNSEIQEKPRQVFTRTKVESDVRRILELYRRSGRFGATVDPKIIRLPQNRVDLVFEISEGSVTEVRSINFIGNRNFSASKLRGVIQTKESRWYRFLSTDDNYDPDRVTYDRELLRKFYLSQGYADFRVVSAVAELTPAQDGFLITFTVDEGERYKFGKIAIESQFKDVKPAELRAAVPAKEGDWYNADLVQKAITNITDTLGNHGYAFVTVTPMVHRDPVKHTLGISFTIKEGPHVYVERIDIHGNVRTLDKVIRREFRLVEGDAFNSTKLQRSEQRVKNLGYFKKVDVTNKPGSSPDKTVLDVKLEEQSTGEFSVGVGYSTAEGPLANIGIRERNLLGTGDDLRINTLVAFLTQQADLSFTEPYFLDRNLAAGFDLFAMNNDYQYFAQYNQFSYGGVLRAGYQINEDLRQTLRYTLRSDKIDDILSTASPYIQDEAGQRWTSAIGQTLLFDRRDNRLTPTAGYYASLSNDLAGLGFDTRYFRTVVKAGYYYSVFPNWILSLTGEAGNIVGIGQPVLLEDRFFVGGDNLRGFQIGGVGPHDTKTDDSLGADNYYVGTLNLDFPTGLPEELGVRGHTFVDFGSAWGIDQTPVAGHPIGDSPAIRISPGIGVAWKSPLGPINLDLAYAVKKETYDHRQLLWVSFGSKF
ncbi:MAG TPA: outer membrane protein assembly factor BamA [Stellaceae bacterium]|nr:outer membrane protein assembly factor BamA [Stellaceae bacterium]